MSINLFSLFEGYKLESPFVEIKQSFKQYKQICFMWLRLEAESVLHRFCVPTERKL